MANGGWRMANGEWRMADGGWRMAEGRSSSWLGASLRGEALSDNWRLASDSFGPLTTHHSPLTQFLLFLVLIPPECRRR
jgi:hypothetical protein